MDDLLNLWRREPARIVGFVAALMALLVAFSVPLTDDQQKAVLAVVTATLALIQAEVTRANVYAPETVERIEDEAFAEGHSAAYSGYVP